jgi:acetyl esterase/lipase
MPRKISVIIYILIGFLYPSQAQQNLWEVSADLPRNVRVVHNIVYGQGNGTDLLLDLYLPDDSIPLHSAIIFIHGGGWSGGNKEMYIKYGYHFASRGIVSASINYRLSGEAIFPAAIEDCKCAIRWMRANSQKYHINPGKIAVAGGSAGGHLAALAGTSSGTKELEGVGGFPEYSSRPDLGIAFFGVFNFVAVDNSEKYKDAVGPVVKFMGGSLKEHVAQYRLASPIAHIDISDPPFLLFHGTGDTVVPYEQSVEFKKILDQSGVPVEMSTTAGGVHGYVHSSEYYEATLSQMEEFIIRFFK